MLEAAASTYRVVIDAKTVLPESLDFEDLMSGAYLMDPGRYSVQGRIVGNEIFAKELHPANGVQAQFHKAVTVLLDGSEVPAVRTVFRLSERLSGDWGVEPGDRLNNITVMEAGAGLGTQFYVQLPSGGREEWTTPAPQQIALLRIESPQVLSAPKAVIRKPGREWALATVRKGAAVILVVPRELMPCVVELSK
jgi:archaellum component FlaG (FlaF/FlaG flagellin family)